MFENWQASIPICSKTCALIMFFLNICFPPLGTFIMAFISKPCSTDQFLVAVLQILTFPLCFVGWVWAIWWGYLCYNKASDDPNAGVASGGQFSGPVGNPNRS